MNETRRPFFFFLYVLLRGKISMKSKSVRTQIVLIHFKPKLYRFSFDSWFKYILFFPVPDHHDYTFYFFIVA